MTKFAALQDVTQTFTLTERKTDEITVKFIPVFLFNSIPFYLYSTSYNKIVSRPFT